MTASQTITLSREAAEIIDRWFLPANPNKLRAGAGKSREAVIATRDACHEFKAALSQALKVEG